MLVYRGLLDTVHAVERADLAGDLEVQRAERN